MSLHVYKDIKSWKIPFHVSKNQLAKSYLKLLGRTKVIGITGSVGKTITQNAVAKVLSQKYNVAVGEENLDPTYRIPQTILKTKPWNDFLVLEYGVEEPGDMDHYLDIIKPNIAVITKITETHTKYFKDKEGVFQEKSKLITNLKNNDSVFLNADEEESERLARLTSANVYYFGKNARDSVKISNYKQDLLGSNFRLHYKNQIETVNWKIIGIHHLLSAHIAATLGLIYGLTLKQIAKGLSLTNPPVHRLNLITTKNANIIDDTYNSSPAAARESIKTLTEVAIGKKKIAILGEMRDLGTISLGAHKDLGTFVSKKKINTLITIGKAAKEIGTTAKKEKFRGEILSFGSTRECIKYLKGQVNKKYVVLVKGSRHEHLERIVYGLLHKSTHITCYHCGELR